jgi:hypothetical protein
MMKMPMRIMKASPIAFAVRMVLPSSVTTMAPVIIIRSTLAVPYTALRGIGGVRGMAEVSAQLFSV